MWHAQTYKNLRNKKNKNIDGLLKIQMRLSKIGVAYPLLEMFSKRGVLILKWWKHSYIDHLKFIGLTIMFRTFRMDLDQNVFIVFEKFSWHFFLSVIYMCIDINKNDFYIIIINNHILFSYPNACQCFLSLKNLNQLWLQITLLLKNKHSHPKLKPTRSCNR